MPRCHLAGARSPPTLTCNTLCMNCCCNASRGAGEEEDLEYFSVVLTKDWVTGCKRSHACCYRVCGLDYVRYCVLHNLSIDPSHCMSSIFTNIITRRRKYTDSQTRAVVYQLFLISGYSFHKHAQSHAHAQRHTHTYRHTHTHTDAHTDTRTHTITYTHRHTHINTHTDALTYGYPVITSKITLTHSVLHHVRTAGVDMVLHHSL